MTDAPLHTDQDTLPGLLSYIRETIAILWKDWPKDMHVNQVKGKQFCFTLNGICPHCKRQSVFVEVTEKYTEASNNNFVDAASVMQCQGCSKLILGIVTYLASNGALSRYVAHYPLDKPDDTVDEAIPKHIAADFKEALRCRWVDAYNATAEMCRRAVEASCIEIGAPKSEKWLEGKIDWLEAQRKITPFLKEVAHKIRLGGNRAAHPPHIDPQAQTAQQADPNAPVEEDAEPPISQEHADAIITFTREFFHHVYVVRKQLDKYDFSRPKKAAIIGPGAAKKGP